MGANAFAVKTWTVGVVAALLAVAGAQSSGASVSPWVFRAALFAVGVFMILDMAYLRQERLFRHLYDAARRGELAEPFTMDTSPFRARKNVAWLAVFRSWSVWPLYVLLTVGVVGLGRLLAGRF
jgi:hypothetical protein